MLSSYYRRVIRLEPRLCLILVLWGARVRSSTVVPPLATRTPEEIQEALKKHAVIPDVIDRAPKHFLMALYRQHDEMPDLGNVLDPNNLEMYPYLLNWPCDNMSLYTLIMTDPDSPSKYKPSNREWHHWLVGNIHVAVEEGKFLPDVFESNILSRYIRPIPKKGTGFHRYILLVYKQPKGRIDFTEKYLSNEPHDIERANFSTRRFAEKYQLGDPVAVSFFLSQWIKPPPTTTIEPWYLPTDYWEDKGALYPGIGFPIHVIKDELEREIKLMKHEVIPDYLSFVPNQTLKVTWISNETSEKVISNFGNIIRPQDLINQPTVEWKAEPKTNYTIIMSELDVPCRSSRYKREKQVWLVVNIPGTNVSAGKTLTSYARPTPWADSGVIRVQVSLYKQQKAGIDWSWLPRLYERASDRSRESFSSKNFTKKYGMSDVIALNFFRTEWNANVTYPEDEDESYEDEAQWL